MIKKDFAEALISSLDLLDESITDIFCPTPKKSDVEDILILLERVMFYRIYFHSEECLVNPISELYTRIDSLLCMLKIGEGERLTTEILSSLPKVKEFLIRDAGAIYRGDPAAHSVKEIILSYPGFYAIMAYRAARLFYTREIPYVPRMMTEQAHRLTGIDIHPGAKIGDSFCIDHGTGVVIGETATIGDRVKLYQGVTIGAKSFEPDGKGGFVKGKKRHPDIGNDCIIYAGATILGGDTRIGDGSVIGGNVWLTHSVPEGSRVYFENKK